MAGRYVPAADAGTSESTFSPRDQVRGRGSAMEERGRIDR
jgi:hypothetical protein